MSRSRSVLSEQDILDAFAELGINRQELHRASWAHRSNISICTFRTKNPKENDVKSLADDLIVKLSKFDIAVLLVEPFHTYANEHILRTILSRNVWQGLCQREKNDLLDYDSTDLQKLWTCGPVAGTNGVGAISLYKLVILQAALKQLRANQEPTQPATSLNQEPVEEAFILARALTERLPMSPALEQDIALFLKNHPKIAGGIRKILKQHGVAFGD